MTMFGSSYPALESGGTEVPQAFSAEQQDKFCWRNASELYGIEVPAGMVREVR